MPTEYFFGAGNDNIYAFANVEASIDLGAGDDFLWVNFTSDITITGGSGADTFRFSHNDNTAHATITDFSTAEYSVQVGGPHFASLTVGLDANSNQLPTDPDYGTTLTFEGLGLADYDDINFL
jgi:Ca2+-binding RTX toxin-like protein